jgi:hypothetical protein
MQLSEIILMLDVGYAMCDLPAVGAWRLGDPVLRGVGPKMNNSRDMRYGICDVG